MSARISPALPPFSTAIQKRLDAIMPPGAPPLVLFTTLARDQRLFERFMDGGLLDQGHLTLRQREVVIDRVTAQCGSEYEWGVHVAYFGSAAGFTSEHLRAFRYGVSSDPCWSDEDRLLIRLCDCLAEASNIDDALWSDLEAAYSAEAVIELILLAGFYRTVSYLANSLRLPLEEGSARFPENEG